MAQHFLLSAGALARRRQDHAHVRQRGGKRLSAPALARNGRKTCLPGLWLLDLLRLPAACGQLRWRKACRGDFSITSGTLFAWHKLREAMASGVRGLRAADRVDRRRAENRSGKCRAVVAMRERDGRTLAQVFGSEDAAVPAIRQRIAPGTVVHADESPA